MGNTEDMQELMDYNSLQDKKTYYNCQLSNDDRRGDYQCCIAPPPAHWAMYSYISVFYLKKHLHKFIQKSLNFKVLVLGD